jgi:endonuclease YncB( thermonuclease family)
LALIAAAALVAAWWLWGPSEGASRIDVAPPSWAIKGPQQSAGASFDGALTGRASVIDGDTIEIQGQRIRILDIDAPESKQTCTRANGSKWRCGQQASLALSDWIGLRTVSCESDDLDRYGRHLANCTVGGQDVAQWLAGNGFAVPYRDCSCEAVRDATARARAAKLGIWSGSFQMPWKWRKAN